MKHLDTYLFTSVNIAKQHSLCMRRVSSRRVQLGVIVAWNPPLLWALFLLKLLRRNSNEYEPWSLPGPQIVTQKAPQRCVEVQDIYRAQLEGGSRWRKEGILVGPLRAKLRKNGCGPRLTLGSSLDLHDSLRLIAACALLIYSMDRKIGNWAP